MTPANPIFILRLAPLLQDFFSFLYPKTLKEKDARRKGPPTPTANHCMDVFLNFYRIFIDPLRRRHDRCSVEYVIHKNSSRRKKRVSKVSELRNLSSCETSLPGLFGRG